MIHFDLPKEKSSIIKVIGVGGGGSNAVNHMFSQNIEGVNFIICNTDAQAIATSRVPNKVQLGPHLTQGLGAGANPDIGRQATEESLEEIKQILEVNTKMAFITAGMGGGTGTGGAPIISKICKDLGILTVGIITTPFSYEGKKRQMQADEGIKMMKQYVDTLLVISNDKLRHQFGNLKMKEAFAKADNVLATAAKCITDVINSTGQINVDFADVCTVMRSGGVAILGNATAKGDNRAQKAIEEALNSPLLNDNDIRGAKWILININSSEGEHEFTMDEVEIIQSFLLSQAGEGSDVIMGLGYDNSLGSSLGITLIATGFEHKDPFMKASDIKPAPKKEEKILMPLGLPVEQQRIEIRPVLTTSEITKEPQGTKELPKTKESPVVEQLDPASLPDALQPKLVDMTPPATPLTLFGNEESRGAYGESRSGNGPDPRGATAAGPDARAASGTDPRVAAGPDARTASGAEPKAAVSGPDYRNASGPEYRPSGSGTSDNEPRMVNPDKSGDQDRAPRIEWVLSPEPDLYQPEAPMPRPTGSVPPPPPAPSAPSSTSGGYLARPSNIYAEDPFITPSSGSQPSASAGPSAESYGPQRPMMDQGFQRQDYTAQPKVTAKAAPAPEPAAEEESAPDMQLVFKEGQRIDEPAAAPVYVQQPMPNGSTQEPAPDDSDDPKRRAAERINKLRNLSFNINAADPNNEFETVPAYIRRNLELYNTISNVENFYSNYEVKTDENNNTEISTINTFLDGKRPD